MNVLSLDTHAYDGSLGGIYEDAVRRDTKASLSFEDAVRKVHGYIVASREPKGKKLAAMATIRLLLGDDPSNWDPKNGIQAKELFSHLMAHDMDKDLLIDILAEIKQKGPCVQGRTTRLLQYYLAIVDGSSK